MIDIAITDKGGKRGLIMEAAAEIFSRKGYHNARMEEIAAAADIGKGTIYEYFSSKLQLFQAVIDNGIKVYMEAINRDSVNQLSLEQFLLLILQGHIEFCLYNKALTRIVFGDMEIIGEELKDWADNLRISKREVLREKICQAMERGEIKGSDPDLVILIIAGMIGSIWAPIVLEDWEVNPQAIAKEITDIIMHGLSIV